MSDRILLRLAGKAGDRLAQGQPQSASVDNQVSEQQAIPPDQAPSEEQPQADAPEDRADALLAIRESGLFDLEFFLKTQPDLAEADVDVVEHFFDFGFREGRKPNPYFDPRFYLDTYRDIQEVGVNALLHYIRHGDEEGRLPCPFFRPAWYRENYRLPPGELALAHFLRNRHQGQVSPIPEFDAIYYCRTYPDIAAAKTDPFEHYINFGWREGRNPSEDFDGRWYTARYLANEPDRNPFLHWIERRHEAGVFPQMPESESTIPREIKRWTRPAAEFEEVRPLAPATPRRAKVLAYYLPQFHAFPENDRWWGKGFTEWTNLPRGLPRFPGHYQPRIPRDLGFYNLDAHSSDETLDRQARMARAAGLHGFVFYYYWFNGKRLMDGPLERLLNKPDIDLPFALMWANENWTRRWDGAESEVLISQDYRPEDDMAMVGDFARHFQDPRYIRLENGRPLLMIYRPGIVPGGKDTVQRWRSAFREHFGEDPIFVMAQAFGDTDPRVFGMDAAIEFPPHKVTQSMPRVNSEIQLLDHEFTGNIYRYEEVVKVSLDEAPADFPLIKTACPSWDNDARRQGSGLVITGSTPRRYQEWLAELVTRAQRKRVFGESLVCINAWNEWCEGAYLEPDLHWGAAYLNATARAISGSLSPANSSDGLILVGHDAFPSGAQSLLLEIGRLLVRRHGVRVEFVLLDGGVMEAAYGDVAPVTVISPGESLLPLLSSLATRGFRNALLNTSVSGRIAPDLEAAGITPELILVHELPRILREKHLIEHLRKGFKHARWTVFPARFVRDAVQDLLGEKPTGEVLICPQGSYKSLEVNDIQVAAFRAQLGISTYDKIVLGAGYADFRKGIDLFLQCWRVVEEQRCDFDIHFVWAGQIAPEVEGWMERELDVAKASGRFHLPGRLTDVGPAFGAADAFLLTSREDPFPTVVLEAMSLGKPVLAFSESGGIPELLDETGLGTTVPYADPNSLAKALVDVLSVAPELRDQQALARKSFIESNFGFAPYVSKLLGLALPTLPRVSVAVPNYNYARYMPERLGSIFRQTLPVEEVIVLDDVSTDDSVDVIRAYAAQCDREVRLVRNELNSGSVFSQWRKAAELATGDWLWIAEADDSSDPTFLKHVLALAAEDPQVVLAFSDSRTVDGAGLNQWDSYKSYYATIEPDALKVSEIFGGVEFVERFLSIKNIILNVSSVVWRRTALLQALDSAEALLRSYRMAGDWLLYLRVLTHPDARVAYEAKPLNVHRRHLQSVTHSLDHGRHLDEIAQCHAFARQSLGRSNPLLETAQEEYLHDVASQFGLSRGE